ncbi:MAG: HupE/UreJ family protein [Cocleimonas sp.]|nr:HupE/UreJ family protein [Cocleimonas sp.]
MKILKIIGMSGLILLSSFSVVFAHADTASITGGFLSGFFHPITGLDHVVAMVAVGLWGVFLGRPAIWVLPIIFPLVMAFGGALGVAGVDIPYIETGIALSGVILGLAVAFAVRPPLWIAAILVGAFAIFHGHAHGTELPSATNPLIYSVGFVIGTGLLHLAGILFGELTRWSWGNKIVRAGGAIIALIGFAFLFGVL